MNEGSASSSFLRVLPRPVQLAAGFYLAHILFQEKIALSMLMAFGAIFCTCYCLAKKLLPFSFHILYFPLFLYGLVSTVSSLAAERRIHAWGEPTLWFKMLVFPAAILLFRGI